MNGMTLNLGNGYYVTVSSIQAILELSGKKLMNEVSVRREIDPKEKAMLYDCAKGRPRKSVVVLNDGSYYICSLTSKALNKRLNEPAEKGD